MNVLTVRPLWAWAIFHAGCDIINRNFPTSHGGKLAIHASKSLLPDDQIAFIAIRKRLGNSFEIPKDSELVFGAIIGLVDLTGCVRSSNSKWFTGDYGFVLRNPVMLAKPLVCRGQLGFWNVPDESIFRRVNTV